MTVEEMQKALDEILNLYKEMENEYGVDLTDQYVRVRRIKNDIPEAIWLAENNSK